LRVAAIQKQTPTSSQTPLRVFLHSLNQPHQPSLSFRAKREILWGGERLVPLIAMTEWQLRNDKNHTVCHCETPARGLWQSPSPLANIPCLLRTPSKRLLLSLPLHHNDMGRCAHKLWQDFSVAGAPSKRHVYGNKAIHRLSSIVISNEVRNLVWR